MRMYLGVMKAIARGTVWCCKCGRSKKVDSFHCMMHGWPGCCGETMTIDSPKEREAMAEEAPR